MAKGRVAQVIGTVVDVEFPPDELPALRNAVEIPLDDGTKIVLETQHHIGNSWARCLALAPTDGLARGAEAIDTGAAISVPVAGPPWAASSISRGSRWIILVPSMPRNTGRSIVRLHPLRSRRPPPTCWRQVSRSWTW